MHCLNRKSGGHQCPSRGQVSNLPTRYESHAITVTQGSGPRLTVAQAGSCPSNSTRHPSQVQVQVQVSPVVGGTDCSQSTSPRTRKPTCLTPGKQVRDIQLQRSLRWLIDRTHEIVHRVTDRHTGPDFCMRTIQIATDVNTNPTSSRLIDQST